MRTATQHSGQDDIPLAGFLWGPSNEWLAQTRTYVDLAPNGDARSQREGDLSKWLR